MHRGTVHVVTHNFPHDFKESALPFRMILCFFAHIGVGRPRKCSAITKNLKTNRRCVEVENANQREEAETESSSIRTEIKVRRVWRIFDNPKSSICTLQDGRLNQFCERAMRRIVFISSGKNKKVHSFSQISVIRPMIPLWTVQLSGLSKMGQSLIEGDVLEASSSED